jgi:hypothetical protein
MSSKPCLLKRTYPNILRIMQEPNFDMSIQKINLRSRPEKVDFFEEFLKQLRYNIKFLWQNHRIFVLDRRYL